MKKVLLSVLACGYLVAGSEKFSISKGEMLEIHKLNEQKEIKFTKRVNKKFKREIYSDKLPSSSVEKVFLDGYSKNAYVYLWSENNEAFLRVEPNTSEFFTCGASFNIFQNNIEHSLKLIFDDDESSYCDDLTSSTTFKLENWSFENNQFDSSKNFILKQNYPEATLNYVASNSNEEIDDLDINNLNATLINLGDKQELSFTYSGNPPRWYKFDSNKNATLKMNFGNGTSSDIKASLYDNNLNQISTMIIKSFDGSNVYENIKSNSYFIKIEDTSNALGSFSFLLTFDEDSQSSNVISSGISTPSIKQGWNLLGNNSNTLIEVSDFIMSDEIVWTFGENAWEQNNPISPMQGFWYKSKIDRDTFELPIGVKSDIFEPSDNGWSLLANDSETTLLNLKEKYNASKVFTFIDNNWLISSINPNNIVENGRGFWVKNSSTSIVSDTKNDSTSIVSDTKNDSTSTVSDTKNDSTSTIKKQRSIRVISQEYVTWDEVENITAYSSNDNDFEYKLNLNSGDGVAIALTPNINSGIVDVILRDPYGNQIDYSYNISNGYTGIIEHIAGSTGDYFLRIEGSAGRYELGVYNAWHNSGITDFTHSFNHSMNTAKYIKSDNFSINESLDNWHRFDGNSGDTIDIKLNAHINSGVIDIILYDPNGTQIESSYNISNGYSGTINKTIYSDGTYYVKVNSIGGNGNYDLEIDGIQANSNDANSDESQDVNIGDSINGYLGNNEDDIYNFLYSGGYENITFYTTGNLDTIGNLGGRYSDDNSGSGNNFKITYDTSNSMPGGLSIVVSSRNGVSGSYTLHLEGVEKGSYNNTSSNSNNELLSNFDGAGSLIAPDKNCWGCNKDMAVMQPSDKPSTVAFQWLNDSEGNCKSLNIEADIENFTIHTKYWSTLSPIKSYNVSGKNKVTIPNVGTWNTTTIISQTPLNKLANIEVTCNKNTVSENDLTLIDSKNIQFSNGYTWTGNGSIISKDTYPKDDFGTTQDLAVVDNNIDSIVAFQWQVSDRCKKLEISQNDNYNNSFYGNLKVKEWSSTGYKVTETNIDFPYTIDASTFPNYTSGNYYIAFIEAKAGEVSSGEIMADCQ